MELNYLLKIEIKIKKRWTVLMSTILEFVIGTCALVLEDYYASEKMFITNKK